MTENHGNNIARRRRESERYYIDGNTARRLNIQSEPQRKKNQQVRQQEPEIRHEKRVSAFDLKYTLFLIVSVGITLGTCFMYMRSNSELTRTERSVAALQSQLQDIQEQNNSLKESLNVTIDLEEVYQIATKRLGMVYASEEQVIYYNSSNSDYVRQYESIPGRRQ
ncbi:MAG: hypothetical protein ACI4BB_06290 [Coprococcus sp.]